MRIGADDLVERVEEFVGGRIESVSRRRPSRRRVTGRRSESTRKQRRRSGHIHPVLASGRAKTRGSDDYSPALQTNAVFRALWQQPALQPTAIAEDLAESVELLNAAV